MTGTLAPKRLRFASRIMKKIIGIILCVVAIMFIFGRAFDPKPEAIEAKIQDWALIAVLLMVGVALSHAKKKPEDQ